MEKNKETKLCAHCKTEINKNASRCPHCGGKNYVWTAGKKVLLVFIIFIFGPIFMSIVNGITTTEPAKVETVVQKTPEQIAAWNKSPAGKLCAKHPTWKEDECRGLVDKKVWIGMGYDMLTYQRGRANRINPSNYGGVTHYQYCWDDYTPSCFYDNDDDGKMDAFN